MPAGISKHVKVPFRQRRNNLASFSVQGEFRRSAVRSLKPSFCHHIHVHLNLFPIEAECLHESNKNAQPSQEEKIHMLFPYRICEKHNCRAQADELRGKVSGKDDERLEPSMHDSKVAQIILNEVGRN